MCSHSTCRGLLKPADINRSNRRGRTPLHEAVRGSQPASFELLLAYVVEGCALVDVNAIDDQVCMLRSNIARHSLLCSNGRRCTWPPLWAIWAWF